MQALKMSVEIPADHRLVVRVPEAIRTGPAELIVLVPSEIEVQKPAPTPTPEVLARLEALDAELDADTRPFRELSPQERRERLHRLRGIGRGLLSSSEEFACRKIQEIEIEERKFGRWPTASPWP